MKTLHMNLQDKSYDISIGSGILADADKLFDTNRRIMIITDDGVPSQYSRTVAEKCKEAKILTLPSGESTKSMEYFTLICKTMLDFGMSRKDALVAVGGGVIGDLAGFAAASYMRGIDFYNIPTTTLSQVDSSIGGKCAVNLGVTKNIIGAFHQPRHVLIDTDTLKTLDKRQIASGLAEAVKMAVTSDADLFSVFENDDVSEKNIEKIICASLKIKKSVVEEDEREGGLRKILNFGHSFGHGIEALNFGKLYHGECVSLGMIPMLALPDRKRLINVLEKLGLPTKFDFSTDDALSFTESDKKASGGKIDAVFSDKIGSFRMENLEISEFKNHIKNNI